MNDGHPPEESAPLDDEPCAEGSGTSNLVEAPLFNTPTVRIPALTNSIGNVVGQMDTFLISPALTAMQNVVGQLDTFRTSPALTAMLAHLDELAKTSALQYSPIPTNDQARLWPAISTLIVVCGPVAVFQLLMIMWAIAADIGPDARQRVVEIVGSGSRRRVHGSRVPLGHG